MRLRGLKPPLQLVTVPPIEPERDGLAKTDDRWKVPWLTGLRRVPKDATWPRLMTMPHPRAVGSLGPEFVAFARERSGLPLRWWQRLVATRMLEVDAAGELVWESVIWSTARQVGKSWLLRELFLWRINQGARFGEPQDVIHTGKDVAICTEVQRPARIWARGFPDLYKVREVNGQETIEVRADGSRWIVRAKNAPYGWAASLGAVDEAWKVDPVTIDEALVPTMAERAQPQLLLTSTAHRLATPLMLRRRRAALDHLEDGEGDLLIEWSAPPGADLDDIKGWRQASPHWLPRRERLIRGQLEAIMSGEIPDPDEPDPEQSFRAQWLNQWPPKRTADPDGEELIPPGRWDALAGSVESVGEVWVAVEDDYGHGAAVAAASVLEDGRIEVDGWLCADWDSALEDALRLAGVREVRQLLIGASMLSRVPPGTVPPPRPAGSRETRPGLALLRDLAAGGMLVHDGTTELDDAIAQARVKENATGLTLLSSGPTHLVRALVWAVGAAHAPAPVAVIY